MKGERKGERELGRAGGGEREWSVAPSEVRRRVGGEKVSKEVRTPWGGGGEFLGIFGMLGVVFVKELGLNNEEMSGER